MIKLMNRSKVFLNYVIVYNRTSSLSQQIIPKNFYITNSTVQLGNTSESEYKLYIQDTDYIHDTY